MMDVLPLFPGLLSKVTKIVHKDPSKYIYKMSNSLTIEIDCSLQNTVVSRTFRANFAIKLIIRICKSVFVGEGRGTCPYYNLNLKKISAKPLEMPKVQKCVLETTSYNIRASDPYVPLGR